MVEFGELIAEMHPGIFIHSVYIDEDQEQDRRAGIVRCIFFRREPLRSTDERVAVRERKRTNRPRR